MPKLSPEAQKKRNAKFSATMKAKRPAAAKDARSDTAVVPLDTLPVEVKRSRPLGSTKGRYAATGQPPIIVQFGKIRISIEVNG